MSTSHGDKERGKVPKINFLTEFMNKGIKLRGKKKLVSNNFYGLRKIRIRKLNSTDNSGIMRDEYDTFFIVNKLLEDGKMVYAQPCNCVIRDLNMLKAQLNSIDTLVISSSVANS